MIDSIVLIVASVFYVSADLLYRRARAHTVRLIPVQANKLPRHSFWIPGLVICSLLIPELLVVFRVIPGNPFRMLLVPVAYYHVVTQRSRYYL